MIRLKDRRKLSSRPSRVPKYLAHDALSGLVWPKFRSRGTIQRYTGRP